MKKPMPVYTTDPYGNPIDASGYFIPPPLPANTEPNHKTLSASAEYHSLKTAPRDQDELDAQESEIRANAPVVAAHRSRVVRMNELQAEQSALTVELFDMPIGVASWDDREPLVRILKGYVPTKQQRIALDAIPRIVYGGTPDQFLAGLKRLQAIEREMTAIEQEPSPKWRDVLTCGQEQRCAAYFAALLMQKSGPLYRIASRDLATIKALLIPDIKRDQYTQQPPILKYAVLHDYCPPLVHWQGGSATVSSMGKALKRPIRAVQDRLNVQTWATYWAYKRHYEPGFDVDAYYRRIDAL